MLLRRSRDTAKQYLLTVSRPARQIWPRASEALIGIVSLLVIALVVLTYSPTMARHASRWFAGNKYVALIDGMSNPFRNRSLLLHSGLPIYDLKIKSKAFAELETAVEEARKKGWMSEDQKVEVDGKFYCDGEEYDVSVRIRGDLPPHWEGPKKSWRIQFGKQRIVDGDQVLNEPIYFHGHRQINLIIPKDRDFIMAPMTNQLMREAGLTVPQDQFVILRINGRMQGLYYEVEQFDKPLFAEQQRPETTVFGQNDRAMHFEQYSKYGTPITSDAKYDVGSLRIQVDEEATLARRAMEVLLEHSRNPTEENFRRAQAVLDWDKFIRFRSLTTLLNTNHVNFGSDNLKLYYDPSRGLFEPIPWDVHLTRMPNEPGTIDFWNIHGPGNLNLAMLTDPELRMQRNQVLWKMVDDGGKRILAKFNALHDRIRPLAWTDVLTTPIQGEKMDILRHDFEHNVHRVHKVLSNSTANLAFRLQATDRALIDVVATNFCGIRWNKLQLVLPGVIEGSYQLFEDLNHNGKLDSSDPLFAEAIAANGEIQFAFDKLILPTPTFGSTEIDGVPWQFLEAISGRASFFLIGKLAREKRPPLEWVAPKIVTSATNAVTGAAMPSGLIHGPDALPAKSIGIVAYDTSQYYDLDAPLRSVQEFLSAHPQFISSPDRPGAVQLSSRVTIPHTIVIPKSVMLVIRPGTDITMSPGASLICYGGLTAEGTAAEPIHIHGDNSAEPWGVLGVVRPQQNVSMRHVSVTGGSQAQVNGILFTGGIAVHHGDLDIANCRVVEMQGEDGLNLKNGRIAMTQCFFSNNALDSCDLDFATGTVTFSHFAKSGNDGLEVSGSSVAITNCRFVGNGDKGCTVGENSHPTIVNCLYLDNKIGASCKDLSDAKIAYCSFIDNHLAIEALRKKPYFGGGSGELVNCVFANNDTLVSEDYFSRGKLHLTSSLLDVSTSYSTCRNEELRFQSLMTGDYRLLLLPDTTSSVTLRQVSWLDSFDIPESVRLPGIYSNLNAFGDESSSQVSQLEQKVTFNEQHARIYPGGRTRNAAEVGRE